MPKLGFDKGSATPFSLQKDGNVPLGDCDAIGTIAGIDYYCNLVEGHTSEWHSETGMSNLRAWRTEWKDIPPKESES